jgi:hypothetical protein
MKSRDSLGLVDLMGLAQDSTVFPEQVPPVQPEISRKIHRFLLPGKFHRIRADRESKFPTFPSCNMCFFRSLSAFRVHRGVQALIKPFCECPFIENSPAESKSISTTAKHPQKNAEKNVCARSRGKNNRRKVGGQTFCAFGMARWTLVVMQQG